MRPPVFDAADRELAANLFRSVRALTASREGVTRPSYGDGETAALMTLSEAAAEHGLKRGIDAASNLVVELPNAPTDPAIWLGSHLDSVPEGGNFDGLAGVVAGLLVLVKLRAKGIAAPVKLIGLRGEESVWFGKPYLGSSALFGKLTVADLDRKSTTGRVLRDALADVHADIDAIEHGERVAPPIRAFIELHIEQGPVLVDAGKPLGIVTGIAGNVRHGNAHVRGEAGHSGTTPHRLRHDAVLALSHFLLDLDARRARSGNVVVTTGIVATDPAVHAITRIADDVRFSLEWRCASAGRLDEFAYAVEAARDVAQRASGCSIELGEAVRTAPAYLDDELTRLLRTTTGDDAIDLPSGAGHDAAVFAQAGVPSAMLFVRNQHGSHNPSEAMDLDDFMLGVEALWATASALHEGVERERRPTAQQGPGVGRQ